MSGMMANWRMPPAAPAPPFTPENRVALDVLVATELCAVIARCAALVQGERSENAPRSEPVVRFVRLIV
ncbi:hypothetical protein FTUN_6739 [Frigoriglobus tundricola]|uniref:Uncharacterized protein n=1 Tax=Frigoriglobus tundricola TaxID=2774151 RepID=A0A6M5YYP0_9BACT|nr:hypothetical protein FTUN_6739 [Frigoriglobus tundricola]